MNLANARGLYHQQWASVPRVLLNVASPARFVAAVVGLIENKKCFAKLGLRARLVFKINDVCRIKMSKHDIRSTVLRLLLLPGK